MGVGDEVRCLSCAAIYARGGEGGMIRIRDGSGAVSERPSTGLSRLIQPPKGARSDGGGLQLPRRAAVEVRIADGENPVWFRGELVGFVEDLGEGREGLLELTEEALLLWGPEAKPAGWGAEAPMARWDLLEISAIQTSSGSVQISPVSGGLVHFGFATDSPFRWDHLLQEAVKEAYRREGRGEIVEFQPRIIVEGRGRGGAGGLTGEGSGGTAARGPEAPATTQRGRGDVRPEPFFSWYAFLRLIAKGLIAVGVRLEVEGLENIPATGPFILVGNHQSVLDPILVQGSCPRPVHTFTKSTQFAGFFLKWLMTRVNAIPTRRYRIDPQVVRVALRRLSEGKVVGVYPEGERSWDGALQPFRQGTIRLLLKAGVPVIPCGVSGSYDVWPRWSRKIKRRRTVLRFGTPILWPQMEDRKERDAAVPEAAHRLKRALIELGAWNGEGQSA